MITIDSMVKDIMRKEELLRKGKEAIEKIEKIAGGKIIRKESETITIDRNMMVIFNRETFMANIGWIDKGKLYEFDLLDPSYHMNTIPNKRRDGYPSLREEARFLCKIYGSIMRGREAELLELKEVGCRRCQWFAPGTCDSSCPWAI